MGHGVKQPRFGKLLRSLTLFDLSVLASSSMAPAYSLAAVMGLVVASADLGAPLALVVSTIPIAFIAAGFMRLATSMPSAGAAYSWTRIAMGNRLGWFTAMLVIIAYYFGTIATAFPAGIYSVSFLLPRFAGQPLAIALSGCIWIAVSIFFLYIGARPTARLSAVFLTFEVLALALIAALALAHPFAGTPPPHPAPLGLTVGASGLGGLVVGAVLSIWITAGWEISTYSSEESAQGKSAPGAGALIGLLGTASIVFVCMVAFMRVGTVDGFKDHTDDALAYVAGQLGGGWIAALMTATVLVSSAASLWTTMLTLSRGMFAMARDGVLPRWLGFVHPRYGSPAAAVLAAGVPVIALMIFAGVESTAQKTLETVVSGSSIFLGATFVLTGISCALLHLRAKADQPRHPLSGIVLPLLGAIVTLAFIAYNVATQQPTLVKALTAVGVTVSAIFAALAGRWSPSAVRLQHLEEEAAARAN